mmetsp:Transcript_30666/g.64255  ORF Transcript_30666/g.64255 Transcript_30666/m.64255 type:complete len:83 (+) Transcript_30666:59-307(+)
MKIHEGLCQLLLYFYRQVSGTTHMSKNLFLYHQSGFVDFIEQAFFASFPTVRAALYCIFSLEILLLPNFSRAFIPPSSAMVT